MEMNVLSYEKSEKKNICIYTIYSMYEISIRLHNTLMIPFVSFNPNIVSTYKKSIIFDFFLISRAKYWSM